MKNSVKKKLNYKILKDIEQRTEEWYAAREGYITGSTAKFVFAKGNAFLYDTLATMTTETEPDNAYKGAAVEWGNEQEPNARKEYAKQTGRKMREVGFIVKNDEKAGLSPDDVEDADVITHATEYKCPNTKKHIEYILENKVPSEHKKQCMHYYYVIDTLQTLDFVSYDPRYKYKKLHIIKTKRADFLVDLAVAATVYGKFHKDRDENYKKLVLN